MLLFSVGNGRVKVEEIMYGGTKFINIGQNCMDKSLESFKKLTHNPVCKSA